MAKKTAKKQNQKSVVAAEVSTPAVEVAPKVIDNTKAVLTPVVVKMNAGDWTGSLRELNARDNSSYAVCLVGNINPFIKTGYIQMRADGRVSLMKKNPKTKMIEKILETKLDMIKVLVNAKFTRNEAK